jgi:uncharacterized protein YbaP (TraB family)
MALTPGLAAAQQSRDPEAAVVQELIVTAPTGGPAWWSVTKGGSTVWILGTPSGLPKGFSWDQRVLDRRLGQARAVLLPPEAHAGLTDIFGILAAQRRLKSREPLEARAPAALGARFVSATAALGRAPKDYDHWNGLMAGVMMSADFRRKARLEPFAPLPAIRRAAEKRHVPVSDVASYAFMPTLRAGVAEITPEREWVCLAAAVDEIDKGPDAFTAAARGWAMGDLKTALTAPRGYEVCFNSIPAGADIARRAMTDETHAIEKALQTPGRVIAVVSLRTLLAQGGVLEQLRSEGYSIKGDAAS